MRSLWFILCLFALTADQASSAPPYKAGQHGKDNKGELRYIDGLPVLILNGTPAEMGEQIGVLAARQAKPLFNFPRDYFRRECTEMITKAFPAAPPAKVKAMELALWPKFETIAADLEANFPKAHRNELNAIIDAAGKDVVDRRQLLATNGMFDLGNISPTVLLSGCSSLIIPPKRSDTGGLLFGRNLDFSHMGYLHEYSLLMVYRSSDKQKHSFVSAGFPGFVGCFTGMNDAGLTIASHEVFESTTKTPFNPKGVPFAMAYRRVLEECTTIADAVKLLKSIERASVTSLVIADVKEGAVIEVTPDAIEVRQFQDKPGVCTNHFCTLKNPKQSDKFRTLDRFKTLTDSLEKTEKLSVADVKERMDAAHMGDLTIQTFVFEPEARKVHVRFGDGKESATKGKLATLDMNKLWGK